MRPNIGYYTTKINEIVKQMEEIGEEMNPFFEEARQAIDSEKLTELTEEKLTEIKIAFEKGTAQYERMLTNINQLKPPVKVIGVHKKFERAFTDYLLACKDMVRAIDVQAGINVEQFNLSEEKQDQATDVISFSISRMTNILLNK